MSLTLQPIPIPLRQEPAGVFRVGTTRVLLELVIQAFQGGASPEVIVQRFPTLDLADVYVVLAYYLRHKEEVAEYLRQIEKKAEEVRRKIEASQKPRPGLKQELIDRLARKGSADDAAVAG